MNGCQLSRFGRKYVSAQGICHSVHKSHGPLRNLPLSSGAEPSRSVLLSSWGWPKSLSLIFFTKGQVHMRFTTVLII